MSDVHPVIPAGGVNKITRLLDRMFEHRLVPFVGAGISNNAKHDSCRNFCPSADAMKKVLAQKLHAIADESPCTIRQALPKEFVELSKKQLCKEQLSKYSLDRVAEAYYWLFGADGMCHAAQIILFTGLKPNPAHRYLAYLAREGLIQEIFTTNYDCCMERAFNESFGPSFNNDIQHANDRGVHVIYDLGSYRRTGGLEQTAKGEPTLRLYKINGCAKAFRYGLQKAEEIILTERQLQDFGTRRWARDLLADRARTMALVFCGFGSEEPQVRHTALAIIDEFRGDMDGTPPVKQSNAPVIVRYKEVSFVHAQLILSYHQAHSREHPFITLGQVADKLDELVFTGGDLALGKCLRANDFFKHLYQAAMGRLLKRLLSRDSDFYIWLGRYTRNPGLWCHFILSHFYPTGAGVTERQRLFGKRPGLFSLDHSKDDPNHSNNDSIVPMGLWRMVFRVVEPGRELKPGDDWYWPFAKDSLLLLCVLLLLAQFDPDDEFDPDDDCIDKQKSEAYGLTLSGRGSPRAAVNIISESSRLPKSYKSTSHKPVSGDSPLVYVIAVPSLHGTVQEEWRLTKLADDHIRVGRHVPTGIGELIKMAGVPERFPEVLRASAAKRRPAHRARLHRH